MRILIVTDCYPPRVGGIETQVRGLAENLVRRGHEVQVITATPGTIARGPDDIGKERGVIFEESGGVRITRLTANIPWEIPDHPQALKLLREHMPGKGDIVHVHTGMLTRVSGSAMMVAAELGLPTVMTWHSMLGLARPVLAATDKMFRWAHPSIVHSAVSTVAVKPLQNVLRNSGQVHVLHNGNDTSEWRNFPDELLPPDPTRLNVVTTIRIAPRKRPVQLLWMFKRALRGMPPGVDVKLTLIGSGPLDFAVTWAIYLLGLRSKVRRMGRQPHEVIRNIYAESDVFMLPGRLESFGIAALEARSAGLVILARDTTGTGEFIHHERDGLIVHGDKGLIKGLQRLARDFELREKIQLFNREALPEVSWDRALDQAESLYRYAVVKRARFDQENATNSN
ncbi:glycosyltransferase family 4 protein [Micrococcales bacterium 31B]|nr:glycosyltransferase family 4 protein [Micrococcales bacterium 31B]